MTATRSICRSYNHRFIRAVPDRSGHQIFVGLKQELPTDKCSKCGVTRAVNNAKRSKKRK